MATFTMYLNDVLDYTDNIGLDVYPIFDADYRTGLNEKIIDHYRFREIGHETADMFIFAMRRKMNEIMPYYNQMYESQALALDPFVTFRSSTTSTNESNSSMDNTSSSTAENSSTSDSKGRGVHSDFPQSMLSENGDYASSADDSSSQTIAGGTAESEDTSNSTGTQTGEGTTSSEGFSGSMSSLLIEYRQTFLNIDLEIIEELDSLFMGLWSNGDEFTPNTGAGYGGFYYGYPGYSL